MKKSIKRILAWMLALMLVFSVFPAAALAEEVEEPGHLHETIIEETTEQEAPSEEPAEEPTEEEPAAPVEEEVIPAEEELPAESEEEEPAQEEFEEIEVCA